MPGSSSKRATPSTTRPPRTAPVRSSSTTGGRATASRSPATTTTGATRRKSARSCSTYIPDNQAALNAALAGEVDVVTGFDANLEGADRGGRRLRARARRVDRQGHARLQPDLRPARRQARAPGDPPGDRPRGLHRGGGVRARRSTARSPSSTPATRTSRRSRRTIPKPPAQLLKDAGRRGPHTDPHDPELLLHDDRPDPRLGPQRGRHHARGRLGRLPDVAHTTSTPTTTST